MQQIHFVAALDVNARIVFFFRCAWTSGPNDPSVIGNTLGERFSKGNEAKRLRATFAECLYLSEPQECVATDDDGRTVLCRFEKVVRDPTATIHSDNEVVAIVVACTLPDHVDLTDREKQIVQCICRDVSNARIAAELKIKSSTVETHRQNIRKKLGVQGTSGIVLYAVRHGLVDL